MSTSSQHAGDGSGRPGPPAPRELPHEADSPAEILAATHLFVVETMGVDRTEPWTDGPDGLQHRHLRLEFRLQVPLKGKLAVPPGDTFFVPIEQTREDALGSVSDYRGFWSHTTVEKGARYLVMASGDSVYAAVLMVEPALKAVLDVAQAEDIEAAMAAEEKFGDRLRGAHGADPAQAGAAALELLTWTHGQRATRRGLFGSYVWARVAPHYAAAETAIAAAATRIVDAPDARAELKAAFVYGLVDALLDVGPTEERRVALLRHLLGLLLQPAAASLHDHLAQTALYNLVFESGAPPPAAAVVVADGNARRQMAAVLHRMSYPRARELEAWLLGTRSP